MKTILLWALVGLAVLPDYSPVLAEEAASQPRYLTSYLDEPPTSAQTQLVPSTARNIVIARVRIVGEYIRSWDAMARGAPGQKDRYAGRFEIVDVIAGDAKPGQQQFLLFGVLHGRNRYKYMRQADGYERFIVFYVADDGLRRLVTFPISESEYLRWSGR